MPTPMPSQDILDRVHSAYTRSCERQIEATAQAYQRQRDLPRIVAVWPDQLSDISLKGREAIVSRLTKEAIAIARMGRDMPHHYERSRHIAILGALRAEKAQLAHLQNCAGLARIVEGAAA